MNTLLNSPTPPPALHPRHEGPDPKRVIWSDDIPDSLADTGIKAFGTNPRGDMIGLVLHLLEDGTPEAYLVAKRADGTTWSDSRNPGEAWDCNWVLPVSRWARPVAITCPRVKRTLRGRKPYRQADPAIQAMVRDWFVSQEEQAA